MRYGSGLFVGYRFHGRRDVSVSFRFEHGLSYSSFGYSAATATPTAAELEVALTVTNTGPRGGCEAVLFRCGAVAVGRRRRQLSGVGRRLVPELRGEVLVTIVGDAPLSVLPAESTVGKWPAHPIEIEILGGRWRRPSGRVCSTTRHCCA